MSYRLGAGAIRYSRRAPIAGPEAVPDEEVSKPEGAAGPACPEGPLLDALRRGDERAFEWLIDQQTATMLRLARRYTPSSAIAEEVVQETWLAVVRGLGSFEGRSSLRTWIFRILVNKAKSSGLAERRNAPMYDEGESEWDDGAVADAARLRGPPSGYWSLPPNLWDELPEDRLLASETLAVIERAVERLRPAQQAVFVLRDLQNWTSAEVCETLDLTEANQRVLLHRARARVRSAIEEYFDAR